MCLSYESIREHEVNCAKPHACGWCGKLVLKGERAAFRAYKSDGDFNRDWMHLECAAAMNKAPHETTCEGWSPGDFRPGSTEPA